jgi:hypothetical protein
MASRIVSQIGFNGPSTVDYTGPAAANHLLTDSLLLAAAGAACGAVLARTLSASLVSSIKTADQTVVLDLGVDCKGGYLVHRP